MQERRVRLGDILDDYCPRERRVTNHAVVAMVEDEVKQTRCTTCDADHEYKHARVPAQRRKKASASIAAQSPEAAEAAPVFVARTDEPLPSPEAEEPVDEPAGESEALAASAEVEAVEAEVAEADGAEGDDVERAPADEDDWPVHRPLIRATLPRPEGQVPERREPDFTIRQNDGRANGQRNGNRRRRNRQQQQTWQGLPSGPLGHGGSRSGQGHGYPRGAGPQGGNQQRQGNRDPNSQGQGNRPGPGGGQGPRRRGRKRGGR